MALNRRQFIQASATTVAATALVGSSGKESVVIDTALPVGFYNATSIVRYKIDREIDEACTESFAKYWYCNWQGLILRFLCGRLTEEIK